MLWRLRLCFELHGCPVNEQGKPADPHCVQNVMAVHSRAIYNICKLPFKFLTHSVFSTAGTNHSRIITLLTTCLIIWVMKCYPTDKLHLLSQHASMPRGRQMSWWNHSMQIIWPANITYHSVISDSVSSEICFSSDCVLVSLISSIWPCHPSLCEWGNWRELSA